MKTFNNRIFRSLVVFCLLLVSFSAFAQKLTVSGTVTDSKGEPVIGAAVMVEGSKTAGAITDLDGKYSITIPSGINNPKINVSCISYVTKIIELQGKTVLNVSLEEDTELLDEVVVVGYGSMRRSDLTGSVTSVKIDENEAGKSTSFDQMLTGHAAGVSVTNATASPDAGVSIRIRGVTSLNTSSEPLYVVDGVIMSDVQGAATVQDQEEAVNGLMGINPNDIASIEILKDASATAIYGAAGANGVVLITTKQATNDKPTIRFNAGYDISVVNKRIDVLSTEEYIERLRKWEGTSSYASALQYIEGYENGSYVAVDWQDYLIKKAPRHRVFLSISGRPKNTNYNLSLGYTNTNGLISTTGNKQYTARLNLDKTFSRRFKLGTKVNLALVDSQTQQGATSNQDLNVSSMLVSMISFRPLMNVKPISTEEEEEMDDDPEGTETRSSPDRWTKDAYKTRLEYRITPSMYAQYEITKWLTFKTQIGADYRFSERGQWKGPTVNRSSAGGLAVINEGQTYRWTWDNTLMFNKKFKKGHTLSGTLGMTMGRSMAETHTNSADNVQQYTLKIANINSAYKTTFSYGESAYSNVSFFGRGIYNYKDKYVLTATYRIDGSSKFVDANKFAHFPSMAFAWRLNNEPWFNVPVISMAKLRLGWGRVGNSNVSPYQTYSVYSTNSIGNHFNAGLYSRGLGSSVYSTPDLKWETTEQYNVGFDYGMFKGRLTLSADAYYKSTYDLLQNRKVPYASGYSTKWMNVGTISNRGLEFSFDANIIHTKDFEWNLAGNISFNKNRLESIGFEVDEDDIPMPDGSTKHCVYYLGSALGSNVYLKGSPANIFIQGEEIGLFYGYKTNGIVQEGETGIPIAVGAAAEAPGTIKYCDLNGNGYLDTRDQTIIGNPNPKFTYGFNTSLSYKRFTFTMAFEGVYGRDIYNANLSLWTDPCYASFSNFLRAAYYGAWTPENKSNKYMILNTGTTNSKRGYSLDSYIEDGSYLRLQSIALNYDFNLPKNKVIKGLALGVSAQNLFIFTKYTGWDPNVSSFGGSMDRIGIDAGSYPSSRTFCFDLKFTF